MEKINEAGAAPRSPKFTPGPWKANCFLVTDASGDRICHTGGTRYIGSTPQPREAEANAALIAAAPDGYALAVRLVKFFGDVQPAELPPMVMEDPSVLTQFVEAARAFIAKTEDSPSSRGPAPKDPP